MTQTDLFTREQLDQITACLTVENTLQEDLQTRKTQPFTSDNVGEFMQSALDKMQGNGGSNGTHS